jgi:hypothetical protein
MVGMGLEEFLNALHHFILFFVRIDNWQEFLISLGIDPSLWKRFIVFVGG